MKTAMEKKEIGYYLHPFGCNQNYFNKSVGLFCFCNLFKEDVQLI